MAMRNYVSVDFLPSLRNEVKQSVLAYAASR